MKKDGDGMRFARCRCPILVGMALSLYASTAAGQEAFAIRCVDAASGNGVPMIELRTTANQRFLSDSAGWIAIDDPTLMDRDVFFHISGHGYQYPKDGFGFAGKAIRVTAGAEATIPVERVNIAERLYRITGAGIYRDSIRLGKPVPIPRPLLNGEVCGQDSVQATVFGGKVHWFWGDTGRLSYPLGNFNTAGATSPLPSMTELAVADGIDLTYFTDATGFSCPMFERENGVLIWIDGLFTIPDDTGEIRMVTHYSRRASLEKELSHGLAVWSPESERFVELVEFPLDARLQPGGQAFRNPDESDDAIYFARPYATVRVAADWQAIQDLARYEAFTPLAVGSERVDEALIERDATGAVVWGWKANTPPVPHTTLDSWVAQGIISAEDNRLRTVDAESGKPVILHAGSIRWNPYRQRWVLIAHERGGGPSRLGEVWYSESRDLAGPFDQAVRIATHDKYSFYNVTHHDFLDSDDGRYIFFEGTYTRMFSDTREPTPLYDYNQIMYRLDLDEPRLRSAHVDKP